MVPFPAVSHSLTGLGFSSLGRRICSSVVGRLRVSRVRIAITGTLGTGRETTRTHIVAAFGLVAC